MRRTPEEARRVILDAAEAQMAKDGPAGIRLQDVAKAAGVSHPTILHHFGNRAGLIQALNQRTVEDLRTMLVSIIGNSSSSADAMGPTFAAYRGGLAQRMVWLVQTQTPAGVMGLPAFDAIVASLHAMRQKIAAPGVMVNESDTRALVHLTTIAAFGDALIGPRLRRAADETEEVAQRQRFESWFSALISGYIDAKSRA